MSACNAAELLWNEQVAETFHQLCEEALGRDCLCQEDSCGLMDEALSAVSSRATA